MYKEVKNIISKDECKSIKQLLKKEKGYIRKDFNCQMDTDFQSGTIPELDKFLKTFLDFMRKETNLDLLPSYSYARIYRKGSVLVPHVDRKGSEYALTINISQTEPWDIYMNDKPIRQNIGDGLIYTGCKTEHSRKTYEGDEYIQLMLFYKPKLDSPKPGGPILIEEKFHVSKLKEIVDRSGEPCEGNCFWKHRTTEYQQELSSKRTNLSNLSSKTRHIMEIGFNAGHSCLLFLLSNPESKIVIFDINEHSYTRPCFDYLDKEFPKRMTFIPGNSTETVPKFAQDYPGVKFDLIHIDGGHDLNFVKQDLNNSRILAAKNHVVISDDDNIPHIYKLHRKLVDDKVLEQLTHDVLPTTMYTHFVCRFRTADEVSKKPGGPLLIDDVFAINEEFTVEVVDDDIIVIDNMFKDWINVRNVYIDAPVFNWKMPEGTRNFIDYYDCRHHFLHHQQYPFTDAVCKVLEHVHKYKFRRILGENNAHRTNWFKQIKPKTSDWAQIHHDGDSPGEFTAITFLNTEEECSGGTSIFKTMKRRDMDGHTAVNYWSKVPKEKMGKIINIEMKPNRTVIFKSDTPHAAWHPIDSFYDFPRHNIVFRFQRDREQSKVHVIKKV